MGKMIQIRITAIFLLASVALIQSADRPSYIECLDSNECSASQCCLLSQQRYSLPTCSNQGGLGSPCRPNSQPADYNIGYPNGYSAVVRNAYLDVCGCAEGLQCDRATSTCQ
ncbi:Astakine [Blattella germanica]|nr:Astakine [Blattella germanica]